MQGKVARQVRRILTPSESSAARHRRDFGVDPDRLQVILLGVDDVFVPPTAPRVPGRILAMASADAPMKGIATCSRLRQAAHRARPRAAAGHQARARRPHRAADRPSSASATVHFVHGISDAELVELMGSAEMACVPSLYEGFSLPTAELMACATPLVVAGPARSPRSSAPTACAPTWSTPGDVGELTHALAALLDDPERRARWARPGRRAGAGAVQLARRVARRTSGRATTERRACRAETRHADR